MPFFKNNKQNLGAFLCLLAGFSILGSCKGSDNLNIYYENCSDVNEKVSVETYLDGKLIDTRDVIKGDTLVKMDNLKLKLSDIGDTVKLQFRIQGKGYHSECNFSKNAITQNSWVHVNLREILFRKGDQVPGQVLEKDSLIEKEFYCELVQNPK
jgi:hypothetical protein